MVGKLNLEKVTDPNKIVTDKSLLKRLEERGIDKDYVEFTHDYGVKDTSKGRSPFMKSYVDLQTGNKFSVVAGLPKTKIDGTKIVVGFNLVGNKFISDTNLMSVEIDGAEVKVTADNDQPTGIKTGDWYTSCPVLKIGGVVIEPDVKYGTLLAVDPTNEGYSNNVVEWNYGSVKRRVRIIEGRIGDNWIFTTDPKESVEIDWDQTGPMKTKIGFARNELSDKQIPIMVVGDVVTVTKEGMADATYPIMIG